MVFVLLPTPPQDSPNRLRVHQAAPVLSPFLSPPTPPLLSPAPPPPCFHPFPQLAWLPTVLTAVICNTMIRFNHSMLPHDKLAVGRYLVQILPVPWECIYRDGQSRPPLFSRPGVVSSPSVLPTRCAFPQWCHPFSCAFTLMLLDFFLCPT